MIKPSAFLALLSTCFVVSCEDDYPDYIQCHCHDNVIGDWTDTKDSTVVSTPETVEGFDISVETWEDSEIHDIQL